jgi:hypothetical protein
MNPWTLRIVPVLVAPVLTAGTAPAQDSRLAAARREGKVVWHMPLALDAPERLNTPDTGHFVFLKRKGLLAKYTPAGADRLAPAFRDREGFAWVAGGRSSASSRG